jgi:hypothetical protein
MHAKAMPAVHANNRVRVRPQDVENWGKFDGVSLVVDKDQPLNHTEMPGTCNLYIARKQRVQI